jgi:hypothetical protein
MVMVTPTVMCFSQEIGPDDIPQYVPLPGRAVGVVARGVAETMEAEGRTGPEDVLGFGYGEGSYRRFYVPCEGKPGEPADTIVVSVGPEGLDRRLFESVCLARSGLPSLSGDLTEFSLVEVEVNGGMGSPAVDTFVATEMNVVEGTEAYPLNVSEAVQSAKEQFHAYLDEHSEAFDARMKQLAEKALRSDRPTGPREKHEHVSVTWLPQPERLRLLLRVRIIDGKYSYAKGAKEKPPSPPPQDSAGQGHPDGQSGVRFGTQFGVELIIITEYSKTGRLERRTTPSWRSFTEELPPPMEAPTGQFP